MSKRTRKNELVEKPLEQKILEETNLDELQSLVDLFNLNMKKKDIIRSAKLSEVQDKIVDQMYKRVENKPDEFSNADLLNYHKIVQDTISKTDNTLKSINTPNIQINQQVNINNPETDTFTRESRQRILDTVNAILGNMSNIDVVEGEIIEDELSQDEG